MVIHTPATQSLNIGIIKSNKGVETFRNLINNI